MTDKMREAFEKWAKAECFDLASVGGFYSDNETHAAYIAWQAAQSAAVPVHDGNYADGVLYKILDDLYARGWADRHKGRGYDPRGTVEWQAVLDIFARAAVPEHIRSIKIPTDAMEQEFQKHYRRGYEAGKGDAQSVPVAGEVVGWITSAGYHFWPSDKVKNPDNFVASGMRPLIVKPTTSITAAELDALHKRIKQLEAERVPEGYVLVQQSIHPLDCVDGDKVVQLLANTPDAGPFDNPQDFYQFWWQQLLLAAAPQPKMEGE